MNRAPDNDVDSAETEEGQPVGRVVVDSRGHNVWQWARDAIGSTSVLLKRLDNKDLALEPTQKVPVVRGAAAVASSPKATAKAAAKAPAKQAPAKEPVRHPALQRERDGGRDRGGGFDPYNSR